MASYMAVQLLAFRGSTLLTFLAWLAGTLTRPAEQPRLSFFVVLLLAGFLCFGVSCQLKWLSRGNGRIAAGQHHARDGPLLDVGPEVVLRKSSNSHLPNRSPRYSLPVVTLCIVLRLEIFHHINHQPQCASLGVESFLCLLLIGYEIFVNRRKWGVPTTEDANDPWRSFIDDLYDWFTGPRVTLVVMVSSACLISVGTYLSVSQIFRSTYLCFIPLDSWILTLACQVFGLLLDTIIITLLWRVLVCTRTLRSQLRVLSSVMVLSSLASAVLGLGGAIIGGFRRRDVAFGSLHGSELLVDSTSLAVFISSLGLWMCETSPITPISVVTFLIGTWNSVLGVISFGDWMHRSQVASLLPIWLVAYGTVFFTYTHDIPSVMFVGRPFLTVLFMVIIATASIVTISSPLETFGERHPINDLIYDAQTEHTRYLLRAGTSQSLTVAVEVYEERHAGKVPPPYFSDWYHFASGSPTLDDFEQIDRDLSIFWRLTPAELRSKAKAMTASAEVAVISVKNGNVIKEKSGPSGEDADLDGLVDMMKMFSQYLPDMVLPINLSPTPRILPSWEDVQTHNQAKSNFMAKFIPKRWLKAMNTKREQVRSSPGTERLTRSGDFRRMQLEACSPTSRARTIPDWRIEEFCWECAKKHSWGQLLSNFAQSLDICGQPDLGHLHGFYLTDKPSLVIRQVMPLFGSSKTDGFKDILIPLPRAYPEKPDVPWQFPRRYDRLFWRGSVGNNDINGHTLRGSHKFRLLHLLNSSCAQNFKVSMVLPASEHVNDFGIERVSAADATRAWAISAGIIDYSNCTSKNCEVVKNVFGVETDTEKALEHRYVLLTDENDGPAKQILQTLRSNSVPFISTIFRSWFTERLRPWLHFVPIDVRYTGLHTTIAYFMGTKNPNNDEKTEIAGVGDDGEWISRQGRKWAEQALSRKEMEIYLFRLLLEWGRLIDDRREAIGFRKTQDGAFRNDGWTRQQEQG